MAFLLIKRKKDKYGPIMNSLIRAGMEVHDEETTCLTGNTICFENRPESIPKTKIREGKLGWWMCDLRNPYTIGDLAHPVDAIFLCNKQYLKEYECKYKVPCYYVPQTGLSDPLKKGRPITSDIVFIGSIASGEHHANRWGIIEELQKQHNVRFIFNEGTTSDQRWLYRKTPISLAISPQVWGYTSNRLYNVLASGGFCLTLWFPGIEDLFQNHKHLVWFHDAREAAEQATYYLKHKDKRDKIARAGKREYDNKHTAKHRITTMLSYL